MKSEALIKTLKLSAKCQMDKYQYAAAYSTYSTLLYLNLPTQNKINFLQQMLLCSMKLAENIVLFNCTKKKTEWKTAYGYAALALTHYKDAMQHTKQLSKNKAHKWKKTLKKERNSIYNAMATYSFKEASVFLDKARKLWDDSVKKKNTLSRNVCGKIIVYCSIATKNYKKSKICLRKLGITEHDILSKISSCTTLTKDAQHYLATLSVPPTPHCKKRKRDHSESPLNPATENAVNPPPSDSSEEAQRKHKKFKTKKSFENNNEKSEEETKNYPAKLLLFFNKTPRPPSQGFFNHKNFNPKFDDNKTVLMRLMV